MIVAFVAIGGFLYWLNGQAAAEKALEMVEDTTTEAASTSDATVVAPTDIQLDATPFEGQTITLEALEIQGMLGTQGFWLGMPNGNPFLVSMSEDVMAEGLQLAQGGGATVTGMIHAIGDGERLQAEFATHYMEAEAVRVIGGGAGGAGN